jgi:hypothetical protein
VTAIETLERAISKLEEMRILTVRQPWSEAIIFGGKDVENRTKNLAGDYRGPVAIHSAKRPATPEEWRAFDSIYPDAMLRMAESVPWSQEEYGVIIGVVDLIAVHDAGICTAWGLLKPGIVDHSWCSPWAEPDVKHLVLANQRPLSEPIPYRGALGLRRLDNETTARILAQMEAPHAV